MSLFLKFNYQIILAISGRNASSQKLSLAISGRNASSQKLTFHHLLVMDGEMKLLVNWDINVPRKSGPKGTLGTLSMQISLSLDPECYCSVSSVTLEYFMPLSQPAVSKVFSFSYESDTTLKLFWKNGTSLSENYAILHKPF